MDDIFNFKSHIREIITPIMKEMGFKKTNLNFTRTKGRYLEKITIQKSQFNLSFSEKNIFVNYYLCFQDEESSWISFNRLNNKMKFSFFGSWSFFDEKDLMKMLSYLGKLISNYTNNLFEEMENYVDQYPEISEVNSLRAKIQKKCSDIFNSIQEKIPEEEILVFNLEKEMKLPPTLKYCSCQHLIVSENNLESFPARILNQGKELTGLKVVFGGEAIKKGFINIRKIVCCDFYKNILFEEKDFFVNETETDKWLIYSFDNLKMNPGFDQEKLAELAKEDYFATQRADKYHNFDEIVFHIYYEIITPKGIFQIVFCPNENFEKGQKGQVIELRENNPTYEEIMENKE